MARIALIDPGRQSLATVDALLAGTHRVELTGRLEDCAGHDLIIYDLDSAGAQGLFLLEGLGPPALVLSDARRPVPKGLREGPGLALLRKPFDPIELRVVVKRALARAAAGGSAEGQARGVGGWSDFPFVSHEQARVLERAGLMRASVWLTGEDGTGRRRMLRELVRRAPGALRLLHWSGPSTLTSLFECAARDETDGLCLFVHDIERLELGLQESLLSLLETEPGLRLLASSAADPAEATAEGRFSRGLYRRLSALALTLRPLRERPIAIPGMAEALALEAGSGLGVGKVSFTAAAGELLQNYMWPGNLAELETVVLRSLVRLDSLGDEILLDSPDIRFTNDEDRPLGRAGTETGRSLPPSSIQPAAAGQEADFTGLVASLAHEIRNGLTPVVTALQLVAAKEESGELAELLRAAISSAGGLDELTGLLELPGQLGEPQAVAVDLEELVSAALADCELAGTVAVESSGKGLRAHADPVRAAAIVRCLLMAAAGESGGAEFRVVYEEPAAVRCEVEAAVGGAAGLRRLGERSLPWQLAVARMLAAPESAGLEVEYEGAAMTVRLEFAVFNGEEDERDGKAKSSGS